MICPNIKNKQVVREFNEIVEALGGTALSEEEFKSAELRSLRKGIEYAAMEATYKIWHLNNGNAIDYAPNGALSKLFHTLLSLKNGDRVLAIRAKSRFYTEKFRNQFGDWTKVDSGIPLFKELKQKGKASVIFDENGEPYILELKQESYTIFEAASLDEMLSEDVFDLLNSGEIVDSDLIMYEILSLDLYSITDKPLAILLSQYKIPVMFSKTMSNATLCETVTDAEGNSIIFINQNVAKNVSKQYMATAMMHEIVHAATVKAIVNPKTKEEFHFLNMNNKMFKKFSKILKGRESVFGDYYNGLYAFSNNKEFAAVFITDKNARNSIFTLAKQADELFDVLNLIKKFINSISRMFTSNNIFKTNQQMLQNYQQYLSNFLSNNIKTINTGIEFKQAIQMYKAKNSMLTFNESVVDFFKRYDIFKGSLQKNPILVEKILNLSKDTSDEKKLSSSYEDIVNMLNTRLKSLSQTDKSLIDRTRLINETRNHLKLFSDNLISKYVAITQLLKDVGNLLTEDIEQLKSRYKLGDVISGDEYMYHAHANFGMYRKLTETLSVILDDNDGIVQMMESYNKDKKEQEKLNPNDIADLRQRIHNVSAMCLDVTSILEKTKEEVVLKRLSGIRNEIGAIDLDPIIEKLKTGDPIFEDISWFEKNLGSADSASSPILRSLVHIVAGAKEKAEEEALEEIQDLINISKGVKFKKLYETVDGKHTGYFIRKLLYGKFYKDYDEAMLNINKTINEKFNLHMDLDNRIAPQQEDARRAWHGMRNEWLSSHCERRYNNKYYEAWAKVPETARQALTSYNTEINIILDNPKYKEGDRVAYEKISEEDWDKLQHLWTLKKLLRSDLDMFGNQKLGEELEIAKALRQLDIDLYGDSSAAKRHDRTKKKVKEWKEARDKVIEECGGLEAKSKWERGEKDHGFDFEKFLKWEDRNTIKRLKTDSEGNAIVFKLIDQEMRGLKPYYGEEYEELKEKYNQLVRPFKDHSGQVIYDEMPFSVKSYAVKLQEKMLDIREEAKKNDKEGTLKKLAKQYSEVFSKYIVVKDSKYLTKVFERMNDSISEYIKNGDYDVEDYNDPDFFTSFRIKYLKNYGYVKLFVEDDGYLYYKFTPFKLFLVIEAKDDQYMEIEPGIGWMDHENDDRYTNKEFERLSKLEGNQNVSMIPKESLYTNELFDTIMSDAKYKAFYDRALRLMDKANSKQTNRQYADNYLLPQISGTLLNRISNTPGFLNKSRSVITWILEKIGMNQTSDDDAIIGNSLVDESLNEIDKSFLKHENSLRGKYPDGRPFNMIPQFYTRRMADPSIISTDLINILYQYYLMSTSYELKSKIKGICETILDSVGEKSFKDDSTNNIINGQDSNLYKSMKTFLEMNLYNISRERKSTSLFGKKVEYTKTLLLWKEYATARNLGANPKVATVGLLTSSYVHFVNMITGSIPGVHDKYNFKTGLAAFKEVLFKLINPTKGLNFISNRNSNDKMILLMEFCGLGNLAARKVQYSLRNRLFATISKNYVYGFLSTADFIIKSQIMLSEVMSYRFVDGEFITESDIYYNRRAYGEEVFKDKLNKFKNSKENLYDLLKAKDGKLTFEEEKYKLAWDKIKFVVKNRAEKTAENADGMATQLQRSALHQSIIGSLVLMHRQYLPLMMQEAYGKQVYDYDTLRYKNGLLRSVLKIVSELIQDNFVAGATSLTAIGAVFGGPVGGILGLTSSVLMRRYGIRQGHAEKQGFKKIINKYLFDYSTEEAARNSNANRISVAKTIIEILLFNAILQPAINALCKYYDDDDSAIIQYMLYCLRAFQWEAFTKYRTAELFNNVKSATAASSITDGIMEFGQNLNTIATNTMFPNGDLLFSSPIGDLLDVNTFDTKIQRGAYKGWDPSLRAGFKLTSYHNLLEQALNPKAKRIYNETQIQRLPKSDR